MCALMVKRFSSFLHSSHSHPPHLLSLLTPISTRSQSQSQCQSQKEKEEETPFIAHYLTSSFGFSRDRALKVSTYSHLAAIKSSDRPDSVMGFLKDTGLSDSQINASISCDPLLLSCNVDKTLKPRVRDLMAAGFTGEILIQLIRYNPALLRLKIPVLQLQFWREFVGNDDEVLLKVIRRNRMLFECNTDVYLVPRLNLFREYGLSNQQIIRLVTINTRSIMLRSLDYLRRVLEQTMKLGFKPGSGIFLKGLGVLASYSENSLKRKIAFFKESYGWSEDDFYSAFRTFPAIITYSEERIKSHMDFLIGKAMLDPKIIASQPMLFGCSMDLTLVPRHHVLTILKAHGLKKDYKLRTACVMSEKKFIETCVVPHEKDVPGLRKAYETSCSGKVSP